MISLTLYGIYAFKHCEVISFFLSTCVCNSCLGKDSILYFQAFEDFVIHLQLVDV